MLPRALIFALLGALAFPGPGRAQDQEWEEDYSQEWRGQDQQPPPAGDGYDVSVDLNESGQANLQTFQSSLSPYGQWVSVPGYGQVWRPYVASGWRPYYYGRWEWTNEGWLWVSDEPFGWAAYHYGRWTYDGYYGWVWVPGYQWAPAWVTWRYSGDVVGWAPLGPGVSVYVNSYPFVDFWWTFVPCTHFVAYPVYSVAYAPAYTHRYFYATAPAPPVVGGRPVPGRPVPGPAWGGPPPRAIEQRVGRPITPVRVVPAPSPGQARTVRPGEVAIYRPTGRGVGAPDGRPAAAGPRPFRRDAGEGEVPRNQQAFPQPQRGGPVYGSSRGGVANPAQPGGPSYPAQPSYPAPRGGAPVYQPPQGGRGGPVYSPPQGGGAPSFSAPRGGGAPGYAPQGGGRGAPMPHGGGGGGGGRPAPSSGRGGGHVR